MYGSEQMCESTDQARVQIHGKCVCSQLVTTPFSDKNVEYNLPVPVYNCTCVYRCLNRALGVKQISRFLSLRTVTKPVLSLGFDHQVEIFLEWEESTVPVTSWCLFQNDILKYIWFYLAAFSCFVFTSRDLKHLCVHVSLSSRYI